MAHQHGPDSLHPYQQVGGRVMQRYEMVEYTDGPHIVHREEGEWVRYDDAQAEIARLRKVLNNIYENVEYWNTLQISSKIRAAMHSKEGDE